MLKQHLIHDPGQSKTSSPNETKNDVSIRTVGRYIPPAKLRLLQVNHLKLSKSSYIHFLF